MGRGRPVLAAEAPHALVADKSAHYRLRYFSLTSADGARTYQIGVAIPRSPPPADGYGVLYMLDGDAALARIDEAMLETVASGNPPVIVAVGYAGDRAFNVMARALDYTPPAGDHRLLFDPAGRPGGGADVFLDLLEKQIRPAVAELAPLDPNRQAFWGHSYGGLCVFYAALTRPQTFNEYFAASPSLWWNHGLVLESLPGFLDGGGLGARRLTLMVGGEEVAVRPGREGRGMRASVPASEVRVLAGRLEASGARALYREFPGAGHGAMLEASLRHTLLSLAGEQ